MYCIANVFMLRFVHENHVSDPETIQSIIEHAYRLDINWIFS